jgi:hypothetical protein
MERRVSDHTVYLHPGPLIEAKGPSLDVHSDALAEYLRGAIPSGGKLPVHAPVLDLLEMFKTPKDEQERVLLQELWKLEDSDMVLIVRKE